MTILREHWDRVAGWTCVALGALALLAGWFGVSGTEYPAEQLSYIASGGLGGIFLLGLGATLLLSADLRDEWVLVHRMTQNHPADVNDQAGVTGGGGSRPDADVGNGCQDNCFVRVDPLEAAR